MQWNMLDAKTRLSELVAAAERGDEVIVARNGEPAVRLEPVRPRFRPVALGSYRGEIVVGDDFDGSVQDFAPYAS